MKKYFLGIITGFIACTMLVSAVAIANSPIKLIVNGNEVESDVPPQIIDGRTMVPARPLAEALGADVRWDDVNYAVVVTGGVQAGATPTDLEPAGEATNGPVREPVNNTAKSTGRDGMLRINNEIALNQKWLEKDGDVLVSLSTIGEVFFKVFETKNIQTLPVDNGVKIQIGEEQYAIKEKWDEKERNLFSINSLIATGLVDCTWDSENTNLIVTRK